MNNIVTSALANGFAVAIGLFLLWSAMRLMDRRNRAFYALIAGAVSAIATFAITALISSA